MLQVNLDRLQSLLQEAGTIGQLGDKGVYRMALTDADFAIRDWFKQKAKGLGFEVYEDSALNLFARLNGGDSEKPPLMMGSHLDTVPGAGQLDGALGVLAALEALTVLHENNIELERPVEVVSFSDEEGRFGGMFGSQAFGGQLTPESIFSAQDLDGVYLHHVLEARGINPSDALKAARAPDSLHAFLELHIEQGPVLDRRRVPLGLVEGVVGLFRWSVKFIGVPNHSGTTPMDMRKDAFQALAEFARELNRVLDENGSQRSVCNIGRVELKPGAANVVPGEAEFMFEVRDTDPQVLGDLGYAFRRTLSAIARRRDLMVEYQVISEINPVKCDRGLMRTLEAVVRDLGVESLRMPSGAAHDMQNVAALCPAAMIFVPSKDGKSHSPAEWTDWQDIEAGANLLLNAAHRLAAAPGHDGSKATS